MTDFDEQKRAIDVARRCQRNWDLTREIPEEHIEHWIYLATHAPSKQDESYFDLYVLTDREKIDYLHKEHSWGFTMLPGINDYISPVSRNPQMGANILFIYNKKMPPEEMIRDNQKDGSIRPKDDPIRYANQYASIGISSGIVAYSAACLGYKIGFGKNFGYIEQPKRSEYVWGEILGIPKEDQDLVYSLGIGYENPNLEWNKSQDNKEYLTGGPIDYEIKTGPKDQVYSKYSTLNRDIKVTRI